MEGHWTAETLRTQSKRNLGGEKSNTGFWLLPVSDRAREQLTFWLLPVSDRAREQWTRTGDGQLAADYIYLSPHLDDAVLSCGGQIAQQTRQGRRVLVVTICAGDPPAHQADSAFVRELHARWAVESPVAARRAEDLAALRLLSADALHLDVPDCIYRPDATGRPLYPDREAIFGAFSEEEGAWVTAVTRHLRRLEPLWGATVYAPLGVGHHVDHQLVHMAAQEWGAPGGRLVYYEEYPYAQDPVAVEAALHEKKLVAELVRLTRPDMERKIAAVACYRSQLSTFFSSDLDMAHRLWLFARLRASEAGMAERIWR